MQAKKLLTIRQEAKESGVPEYLIRRMVKANQVPCLYSGNRCYVDHVMFMEKISTLCNSVSTNSHSSVLEEVRA